MERESHTKKSVLGRLSLAVGALSLACLLQGCNRIVGTPADSEATSSPLTSEVTLPSYESPDRGNTSPTTEPASDPSAEPSESTEALRTYYEKLISGLRQELLDEREDRYISEHPINAYMKTMDQNKVFMALDDIVILTIDNGNIASQVFETDAIYFAS